MKKLKLSIIVPIYNTENFLKRCMLSMLCDSNDYEIILINDGSTDNSLNICQEFKDNFKRAKITIINIPNAGVSNARNIGIENSTGDYIMFVDSDDYLIDGWESIIPELDEKYDIVYYNKNINVNTNKEQIISYILGNNKEKIYISGPVEKAIKRKFLLQNNIYFEKGIINGEDMIFNFECILKCKRYKIVNKLIYMYEKNQNSATRNFNSRIFESEILFQEKLQKILEKSTCVNKDEYLNWCNGNHIITILNRISRIRNFKDAKSYYKKLEEQPFTGIVHSKSKYLYRKVIFIMVKLKLYFILYNLYKIKNKKKDRIR